MSSTLSRPLLPTAASNSDPWQRGFDLSLALAGLVALAPLLSVVALLVKLSSPGPVFYRARRVGQGGRLIDVLKFRTMVADADRRGPGITSAEDDRITDIGRWLRRTKIDELPQLINIVRGEMSLVGPRPEDPRYVSYYTPEQRALLAVKPGLTSPASLHYSHEEALLVGPEWETIYITRIMPDKLNLELAYLQRRTLLSDLRVFLATFLVVFR